MGSEQDGFPAAHGAQNTMTPKSFFLLLLTAFCTMAANLLMRAGIVRNGGFAIAGTEMITSLLTLFRQPLFVVGFAFYGIAAVIWFSVVASAPLSTTYPLLVSLTFLLVTIGAIFFFNENVTWQKLIGMAVILAGFFIVSRGGR